MVVCSAIATPRRWARHDEYAQALRDWPECCRRPTSENQIYSYVAQKQHSRASAGPMTGAMEQHPDNESAGGGSGRRPGPGVPGMVPVADKLTSLAHDLNNLLDGSMRQLAMARQSLDAELSVAAACATSCTPR